MIEQTVMVSDAQRFLKAIDGNSSLRQACTIAEEFGITNLIFISDRNWEFTFEDGSAVEVSFSDY